MMHFSPDSWTWQVLVLLICSLSALVNCSAFVHVFLTLLQSYDILARTTVIYVFKGIISVIWRHRHNDAYDIVWRVINIQVFVDSGSNHMFASILYFCSLANSQGHCLSLLKSQTIDSPYASSIWPPHYISTLLLWNSLERWYIKVLVSQGLATLI